MRRIAIAAASLLGGCSLIYNPNNLPSVAVDAEPDSPPIDGRALTVDRAAPSLLLEGQGASGSRNAILVLTGTNFLSSATVTLAPSMPTQPLPDGGVDAAADAPSDAMPDAGGSAGPQINVHDGVTVSADGTLLAVSLDLPVDPLQSSDVPLDVTVMQDGVMVTLPMATTFRGLPELTDLAQLSNGVADTYSMVAITADWTPAMVYKLKTTGPLSVGVVKLNGSGQTAGPGGGTGGAAAGNGGGPGGGKAGGLGGLLGGGGGAGYSSAGTAGGLVGGAGGGVAGDALVSTFATNSSSGGGGAGGVGGGGGGSIALIAGGTLSAGAIQAKGGNGTNGGLGDGAGGSGGTVVLMSGAAVTLAADPDVSAGTAGASLGGASSAGRVRITSPTQVCGGLAAPVCSVGIAFAADAPYITMHANDPIGALAPVGSMIEINALDADGASEGQTAFTFTTANAALGPTLQRGYNHVCIYPAAAMITTVESAVCVDIAYIPQ
ncbi:MAG TPA: hypothetical protein VGM88_20245 [Kofleriaceae bacterium]|jgi:hypothetical protein